MVGLTAGVAGPLARSPIRRFTPQAAVLLLVAAAGWALTLRASREMGGSARGSMGLSLPAFVGMWTPMMAAMMLPAVAPLAAVYARTVRTRRLARLVAFGVGYLAVWAAAGVPAYVLALAAGRVAQSRPGVASALAVGVYVLAGAYQLTGWKQRCLKQCRSPIGLLMQYGSFRGRLRDLAAGAHHGAYCAGCCWSLFVVLVVVGVMNVPLMLVLAATVLLEKLWSHGIGFSRAVGVAALVLAVAVPWVPALAPGLQATGPGAMVMTR